MKYILVILLFLSAFLLYSLTLATGNVNKMSEYFWAFVLVNSFLLVALLLFVIRQVWAIRGDIKENVFGAKLTRKLMLAFAVVTILPSIFLLLVSAQFISYSINSWFGGNIEASFDNGIRLGQAVLDERIQNSKSDAVEMGMLLTRDINLNGYFEKESLAVNLASLKDAYKAKDLAVYNLQSKKLVGHVGKVVQLDATVFSDELAKQLAVEGWAGSIEREENGLYVRVFLMLKERNQEKYILLFDQSVPQDIAEDALNLENSRANYNQLAYAKDAMQTSYLMTLIIATLLAIMLSLVCALFFSKRFTAPLQVLSAGTKAVAQGDFSQRSPIFRQDELGVLTSSFNRMTELLAEAKDEQEASRSYLENVLGSLTAGVIAFESDDRIRIVNASAETILGLQFAQFGAVSWREWCNDFPCAKPFTDLLYRVLDHEAKSSVQVEYANGDTFRVLLCKMITLPDHVGGGYMLVLDDVTELVNAQKEAAWGEVAKRLAHEIRNPLTPIQLSAERLAMKLESKLSEQDASILIRSTNTIVKQVGALKRMVEAFRNYARLPSTRLQKININEVISEVLVLYESYNCKIVENLSNEPLYVLADTAMMRQVIHNLLQNAQDAMKEKQNPEITIDTYKEDNKIIIEIEDNGDGFNAQILKNVFEPYVTNKETGTGLGLTVVKKIIVEHKGDIEVCNKKEGGAKITISLPILEV